MDGQRIEREPLSSQAFLQSVVTSHGPQLTRFFQARVPDATEAQDLVQEVYIRILKLERPDLIRCPKAYLFRVAANIAHEQWLKRSSRPTQVSFDEMSIDSLDFDADVLATTGPEEEAVRAQRLGALATLLEELSPKVRAALIWSHRDGHTYEEISARLSVPRHRVKKYLAKALAHCRRNLATA